MSTLVESPPAASSQETPLRHSLASNATFGVNVAVHDFEDKGKAPVKPSVTWNDGPAANADSITSRAVEEHSQTVPEVNLNGGALPTPSSSRAAPRTQKSSTATIAEGDGSTWGANFWVTLIQPQVCELRASYLSISRRRCYMCTMMSIHPSYY